MLYSVKIIPFLLLCLVSITLLSQDEAYKGGSGDGSDVVTLVSNEFSFKGGNSDGHAVSILIQEPYAFRGGPADGADFTYVERQNVSTKGGSGDGHGMVKLMPEPFAFRGGPSDGYSSTMFCPVIQWTGAIGSGWNVAANWDINQVPCNCNKVVIPSGVSIFPAVNEGLFKVGYWMDDGDYNCEALRIEPGAQLTTRVNNFIENYGQIIIRGTLEIRNSDPDAFKNYSEIQIRPGGLLNFNNN